MATQETRSIETVIDEIGDIREYSRKIQRYLEEAMTTLEQISHVDNRERWINLHTAAGALRNDVRIAENRSLKPLQAEYNRAWNKKWR